MKKYILLFMLGFTVLPTSYLFSQNDQPSSNTSITGNVIDASSLAPMEFANIVLFSSTDSSQVNGTVTNSNGVFSLTGIKPGKYFIRISFIGFEDQFINNVTIQRSSQIDLGKILLSGKSFKVNDVVVSSQRATISYEIDKKVINVSENFSAISGTAVDILENVPSVTVDVEGNVSLRGSGNFTVLIDGRPSVLDASEALQQIPATAIENIEIITNPSAKYDPEGTAGIINIIMKKNKNVGISGVAELNGGLKDKYGTEIIADLKTESLQASFGFDYNQRNFGASEIENNWTNTGTTTSYYNSSGNSVRGRESLGLRGSLSLDLGNKHILTIGARYGDRSFNNNSNLDYSRWTLENKIRSNYLSLSERSRSGNFGGAFVNYKKEFEKKGHEISAEIFMSNSNSDEITTNRLLKLSQTIDGKITTEAGPETEIRTKFDYSLPLGPDSKFETGLQSEFELSKELTSLSNWDITTNQFVLQTAFSNESKYDTKEIAIYSLFSDKFSDFGYQFGLRTEYTGRLINVAAVNQEFKIDRWDYFPSFHFSYEFIQNQQIMASYTKRINRPRGWQLEPFQTWMDPYNVRIGNPALSPEFIDSYELGYQTLLGNTVISVETYYRITSDKIEWVRSVYDDNVTLQTFQNIGKDYSLGVESFVNFDPIKSWNVNLMGNLYEYRIDGILDGNQLNRNSFNWSMRFNNNIKLSTSTQLQFNFSYNSPTVFSQGRREGSFSTNMAIKQELFDRILTATLQIRNLFGSHKHESYLESSSFYRFSSSSMESPIVMLNLRLNLNNYKNHSRNNNGNEQMDYGGMEE